MVQSLGNWGSVQGKRLGLRFEISPRSSEGRFHEPIQPQKGFSHPRLKASPAPPEITK